MTPRNILTIAASIVAVVTLVLAGYEVAHRWQEGVSLYQILFPMSAVVTSLVAIGIAEWVRNAAALVPHPRRGPEEAAEITDARPDGYSPASDEETRFLSVVHKLDNLANEELSAERTIGEAFDILLRHTGATALSYWTVGEGGGLVSAAEHANGHLAFGPEAVAEPLDGDTVEQVVGLRKTLQAEGETRATFVLPLTLERQCTGVLRVVVPAEGTSEARYDSAQRIGADLAVLAPVLARIVQAPDLYARAVTDPVTGLYTRRHLINQLGAMTSACRRYGEALSLVLLDLDNFALCNRNHGKATGDRVLQNVANQVQDAIRDSDVAYRYGPDEVAIILPQTIRERAAGLAERLRSDIRASRTLCDDGGSIITTVSVGVAEFDEDMRGVTPLLMHAEEAVEQARKTGRDGVVVWQEPETERGGGGTD